MNDINKRLCELLGCDVPRPKDTCPLCGKTNTDGKFIDGADFFTERGRIDLLKRMRKREDWTICYQTLGLYDASGLLFYILDDNGSLARAALEFLEDQA